MMRLVSIAAGVAALAIAVPAQAEQWRLVGESAGDPMSLMFVDQSSLTRNGNNATGMVLTVFEPQPPGELQITHSIILRQVDCSQMRVRMVTSSFYNYNETISESSDPSEWRTAAPTSMLGAVAGVICGQRDYTGGIQNDPVNWGLNYIDTKR